MKHEDIYLWVVQVSPAKIWVECHNLSEQISKNQWLLSQIIEYPTHDYERNQMTLARWFLSDIHSLYTHIDNEPLKYISRVMTYGLKYSRDYAKTKITANATSEDPNDRVDLKINEELWEYYKTKEKELLEKFPNIKEYFRSSWAAKPWQDDSKRDFIPEKPLALELMHQGIKAYLSIPKEIRDGRLISPN